MIILNKDKGPIPEGIYYIDIAQSTENKQSGIRTYNNTWYSFSRSKEGEKQWGKYNIPIYTDKDCTNTIESNTQRNNFYIHGGESYGDNGGIDLAKEDTRFFRVLESLKQEYKDILEYIKDDKGRIIIKLEVGYEKRKSEIDLRGKKTPNGEIVEWQSQEGKKYGCYATSKDILLKAGLSEQAGINDASLFQLALEKYVIARGSIKTQVTERTQILEENIYDPNKYLVFNESEFNNGVVYLDSELEAGYPVMVGLNHTYRSLLDKGTDKERDINTDKTTDHFVVIVGRKYDKKGNLYYLFYEVGAKRNNKKDGVSNYNRLYVRGKILQGKTAYNSNKNYIVTQIRHNKRKG